MADTVKGRVEWRSPATDEDKRLEWALKPEPGGRCLLQEKLYRPMARTWWAKSGVVVTWEALCLLADEVNRLRNGGN